MANTLQDFINTYGMDCSHLQERWNLENGYNVPLLTLLRGIPARNKGRRN